MFRHASRLLIRAAAGEGGAHGRTAAVASSRAFSSEVPAAPVQDPAFIEAWKKVAPNIEPPKTPLEFLKPRPPTPSTIPSKLTVNFVLPYQSEISSKEVCQLPFSQQLGFFFSFDVHNDMEIVFLDHKSYLVLLLKN